MNMKEKELCKQCIRLRNFYSKTCIPDYELRIEILDKLIENDVRYGIYIPITVTGYTKAQIISALAILIDDLELYNYNLNTKNFKNDCTIYLEILG